VFENRVPRRIFRRKRIEVKRGWRKWIMRSFMNYTLFQYYSGDKPRRMR
jgi:hypothetical protein